jgi:hypothetical protein
MYARGEHREFLVHYHEIAKRAVLRDDNTEDKEIYRKYRGFRGYMTERYICQIADYLESYLEAIIFEVHNENLGLIPKESKEKIKAKLKRKNREEPTDTQIAFAYVSDLWREGRANVVEQLTNFCPNFDFPAKAKSTSLDLIKALRNLIVHQDSFVDERFLNKIDAGQVPFEVELGQRLDVPEDWALEQSSVVDCFVFAVDHGLVVQQLVKSKDRRTHFWGRRLPN